jgi:hypothetical protein
MVSCKIRVIGRSLKACRALRARAAAKMEASDAQLASTGRAARFAGGLDKKAGAGEAQLAKVCRDASKYAVEQVKGLSCQARRRLARLDPCPILPPQRPARTRRGWPGSAATRASTRSSGCKGHCPAWGLDGLARPAVRLCACAPDRAQICLRFSEYFFKSRKRAQCCANRGAGAQVVKDLVFNRAVLPCTAAARAPALATAGGPSDAEPMET